MRARKPVTVAVIALGLIVLAALAAGLAQVTIVPGTPAPEAVTAVPQVNAVAIIGEFGTTRYVAAGTTQGLRVYELRRVGNQYQVKDVTAEPR